MCGVALLTVGNFTFEPVMDIENTNMGESSKFPKSRTLEIQIFKLAGCLQKQMNSSLND